MNVNTTVIEIYLYQKHFPGNDKKLFFLHKLEDFIVGWFSWIEATFQQLLLKYYI